MVIRLSQNDYILLGKSAIFCDTIFMQIYRIFTTIGGREGLLAVVAYIVAIVLALTLHECAHGLVALWNGDRTAKMYGRLSLNPLRHFDIIGLVMMVLVGFGWAKPVPINPDNFKKRKTGIITVSIAGVVTNILLAFLFALPMVAIEGMQFESQSAQYYIMYFLYIFCYFMLSINISFALFNILPLYPLDGYRLLASFVNENKRGMVFLRRYSLYIMLGLIVLDYIPYISTYAPLNLYIGSFGGLIIKGFTAFWGLIV